VDSSAFINRLQLNRRLLPFAAIAGDDLFQAVRHWALLLWVAAAVASAGYLFFRAAGASAPPSTVHVAAYPSPYLAHQPIAPLARVEPRASELVGDALRVHLLSLAALVVALAAGAVPAESEYLPDSVLCRGVSRLQYLFAKSLSRALVVAAAFLATTVPVLLAAAFRLENDLSFRGAASALLDASLALAGLAALAVALGAWFRNPLPAVAIVAAVVYASGAAAAAMDLQAFSPLSFVDSLSQRLLEHPTEEAAPRLVSALWIAAAFANLAGAVGLTFRNA
jgi:hypothetical protein